MSATTPSLPVGRKPNLNPAPKNRFQESADNISKHRAMVEERTFRRALDYALMQYQLMCAATVQKDPNMAVACGFKSTGVLEFVDVLCNLSETPALIRTEPPSNLDHKAQS